MEDIASLEAWIVGRQQTMATPTIGSRGTNLPGNKSTPGLVSQEARRKTKERTKRRAEESVSESRSSTEEEEEEKDPISLSSDDKEYQGSETPFQSDPVDEPKTPPFKINRPTIRSTPRKSIAPLKRKATCK